MEVDSKVRNEYHPKVVVHPGEVLAERLMELEVSLEDFSKQIDVPLPALKAIADGEDPVAHEMAKRFEQALRIPTHFWLNLQKNFDEQIV